MSGTKRVLVALDATLQNPGLLEAAADLAHRLGAELEGLFVEDIDLIHLAGLPFAREHRLRHAARQLDLASLEQDLKFRAAAARRALMQAAERRQVRWRFEVRRGQPATEYLAAAAGAELVAMTVMSRTTLQIGAGGDVSHSVVQSAGAALLCGQAPAADPARPILLLYDASPAATQALELAIRLAGHPGGITVITLATDAARAAALRQRAAARLQSESIAFRLRDLGAADTSAAIELLRREHGSLVLLPVDGTMPAGLSLQILLQRLGLPVLQVRAKGSEPA